MRRMRDVGTVSCDVSVSGHRTAGTSGVGRGAGGWRVAEREAGIDGHNKRRDAGARADAAASPRHDSVYFVFV